MEADHSRRPPFRGDLTRLDYTTVGLNKQPTQSDRFRVGVSYGYTKRSTFERPFMKSPITIVALYCGCLLLLTPKLAAQTPTTIQVKLDPSVAKQSVSGRLYVFLSQRSSRPLNGPSWFGPEPFFSMEVRDWKPGDTVTVDDDALGLQGPISQIVPGTYKVQALLDHDFYFANHRDGPGNYFSKPVDFTFASNSGGSQPSLQLVLDQVIEGATYAETDFVKFVTIPSKLLGDFHGREVLERAMVVLPPSYYEDPDRRYPVYVQVTGFGATLAQLQNRWKNGQPKSPDDQTEFIKVYLTGQCKWGHHVYANSATNGPRGDMLVQELIPEIDKRFRTIAEPTARFVGGHSSGGWSSLWLQVNYPKFFGGVWSTAPDPVDFRDWQGTNLYEPNANVYFDAKGNKRPLARRGEQVLVDYKDFTQMDDVLGEGGQIRSFDAVFSPQIEGGIPARLWDRESGLVNKDILEYWKQYDISRLLEQNWSELEPDLKGKIHVYMGDIDTFYLEGATRLLGQRLQGLGSDAVVEMFPGKDHMNLLDTKLRSRIQREMSQQFWKNHPPE